MSFLNSEIFLGLASFRETEGGVSCPNLQDIGRLSSVLWAPTWCPGPGTHQSPFRLPWWLFCFASMDPGLGVEFFLMIELKQTTVKIKTFWMWHVNIGKFPVLLL